MKTERKAYVVYFKKPSFVNKLIELEVNVSFVSQKQKAAYFYCDESYYAEVKKTLENTKYFVKIEEAPMFKDRKSVV